MTKEKVEQQNVYSGYEIETRKFIYYMCRKGCKFYTNQGCSKKRVVKECARKGLKNKE